MPRLDPIDLFQREAFRLEQYPHYEIAEEAAALDLFRRSGSIPADFNKEWLGLVRQAGQRGGVVRRLRLVSELLSEYERFELLAAYKPSIAAGEDIRVAVRGIDSRIPAADYWLYDDKVIEYMEYSQRGEYLGSQQRQVVDLDMTGLAATRSLFERSPTVKQFCQSQSVSL